MVDSIRPHSSPSGPHESSGLQLPKQALAGITVKPGDEKLLDTKWGKWMETLPGAASADKEEMIKVIKASIQQYCNMIKAEIEREDKEAKKVAEMMKRVAQGGSPDE